MNSKIEDVMIYLVAYMIVGILAVVLLTAMIGVQMFVCQNSFKDSALQSRFVIPGGCQVNHHKYGWIPARTFRAMD